MNGLEVAKEILAKGCRTLVPWASISKRPSPANDIVNSKKTMPIPRTMSYFDATSLTSNNMEYDILLVLDVVNFHSFRIYSKHLICCFFR